MYFSLFCCMQLESEATHRAVTIANRVQRLLYIHPYPNIMHCTCCWIIDFFCQCRPIVQYTWSMCPVCLQEIWLPPLRCKVGDTTMRWALSFSWWPLIESTKTLLRITNLSTPLQAKWSTQRQPLLTLCSTGHSTTTRTGLTLPPMSLYPLCASTPTRQRTSWVFWPSV